MYDGKKFELLSVLIFMKIKFKFRIKTFKTIINIPNFYIKFSFLNSYFGAKI